MNPVEQLLLKKFGRVRKAANNWIRIPCPTCTPHNARKMKRYVNLSSLFSRCWLCERNDLTFMELTGADIQPSLGSIKEEERVPHEYERKLPCTGTGISVDKLPQDHPAIKFLTKDYLFNLPHYAELGWFYVPADQGVTFMRNPWTTSAERLVFPVKFNRELVGWQMRSIPGTFYGDRPEIIKYYHLFPKGDYLYNYDEAIKYPHAILVEGIKKALKLPGNGVASLGKGLSSMQIQLLQRWPKITIMLDGEEDTQENARELVAKLQLGTSKVVNIDLREHGLTSPDEAPAERMQQIVYNTWNKVCMK